MDLSNNIAVCEILFVIDTNGHVDKHMRITSVPIMFQDQAEDRLNSVDALESVALWLSEYELITWIWIPVILSLVYNLVSECVISRCVHYFDAVYVLILCAQTRQCCCAG